MTGIKIGNKHTYDDFGLRMLSFHISHPEPYITKIEIPGMDGVYDASESLSGEVHYKNRTLTAVFDMEEPDSDAFFSRYSEILNAIHGLRKQIIPDTDKNFYYEGRVTVSYVQLNFLFYQITITADMDPYKKKLEDTVVTATVSGTKDVVCENLRKSVLPVITASAEMTLTLHGTSITVNTDEKQYAEIKFAAGSNTVTCEGTGTVTFTYREASL